MTYVARIGLVLITLLFLASVSNAFGWSNAPGLRFFGSVVFINFFFILLAGLSHFASAITEEKEEMTLGLLRMTNLNALSILLGKSTSRIVNALLMLLAQFPFTLLAISLGGVAIRQVIAAYCTLGAFLFGLANLALLASVICRRSTGAAVATALTIFTIFVAVPFLRWVAMFPLKFGLIKEPSSFTHGLNQLADVVELTSPIDRLGQILSTGFADSPAGVQVWSNLAIGAACFLLAWALFERFCNEQQEATPGRRLVARRTTRWRWLGPGRVWASALAWKDFYFVVGGKSWLLIKLLLYAAPGVLFVALNRRFREKLDWDDLGGFVAWISFMLMLVEMAFIAASFLWHERRWKTLSSLAMLPMSLPRIAYLKLLGCLPALFPAFLYFAAGLFVAFKADDLPGSVGLSGTALSLLTYAIGQGVFFLHLTVLLSLHLRRGALPAAIASMFVYNLFVGIVASGVREASVMGFLGFVTLFLAAVLHHRIGRRLEQLAEEE